MNKSYRSADIRVNSLADIVSGYRAPVSIGLRIRQRRKELQLTQVEVAKISGIQQGTLSDLERGKTDSPAGETLVGLCKALQTSARWIIHGTGPHNMQAPDNEEEQAAIALLRVMTDEQRATWIRLGRALLDDPPNRDSTKTPPEQYS